MYSPNVALESLVKETPKLKNNHVTPPELNVDE